MLVRKHTMLLPRGIGLIAAICAAVAAEPALSAQVTPDGRWTVQGRGIMGTGFGDWFVQLSSLQGQLSGVVGLGKGNVPLRNVVLRSNGTFTGSTPDTWDGPRHIRGYHVFGRFSADRVTVTIENRFCPARTGSAPREASH